MPSERHAPDSPAEWLNRAASDLAIAEATVRGAYLEDLCYHAQQCAEKALKGILLRRTRDFPHIHDLAELVNQVEQSGLSAPAEVRSAVSLTEYAVEGRYPSVDEPVTDAQWREAISKARTVLEWARKAV